MTKTPQKTSNRNLSVDRERISNACLIGLYVVMGNHMMVKLPSKRAKNTLAHLAIANTKIRGEDVTEIVQRQYNFPLMMDKNRRRDKEVAIFNEVSKEVIGKHFKLAKRTTAVKTLKLKIFKEIAVLNKTGVVQFGTRVIHNLMNRNPVGKCSQRAFVELRGCDAEILQIFREVCAKKENIVENAFSDYPLLVKIAMREEEDSHNSFMQMSFNRSEDVLRSPHYSAINECVRGVFRNADSSVFQTSYASWFLN